jgi:hypothetical protein
MKKAHVYLLGAIYNKLQSGSIFDNLLCWEFSEVLLWAICMERLNRRLEQVK